MYLHSYTLLRFRWHFYVRLWEIYLPFVWRFFHAHGWKKLAKMLPIHVRRQYLAYGALHPVLTFDVLPSTLIYSFGEKNEIRRRKKKRKVVAKSALYEATSATHGIRQKYYSNDTENAAIVASKAVAQHGSSKNKKAVATDTTNIISGNTPRSSGARTTSFRYGDFTESTPRNPASRNLYRMQSQNANRL